MTAPLTPADCDLRGFAFMPLDVGRLVDSDTWLLATGDEAKACMTLWARAWHQVPASSLPNDDRVLAKLSGAGRSWPKVREVALRGFVACDDGRLYHPVIAAKALEALKLRRVQSKRALDRWQNRGNAAASVEPVDKAMPPAMPPHSHGNAGAMQQTGTGTVKAKPNPPLATRVSPPKSHGNAAASDVSHGTRLASDWTLPTTWAQFAQAERPDWSDVEIARQAETFADHWHSIPGQDGRKRDWSGTWRNWVRRQREFERRGTSQRETARQATARAMLGGFTHANDPPPDDDPRDVTGESERIGD